jgi:uncharacterized membrane protein YphA (DoxX/SURF4 family)
MNLTLAQNRHLLVAGRWVAGGVFLLAGALKAWDPAAFLDGVRSFALLPAPLDVAVALGLPWLEMTCGLALIAGRMVRGALLVTLGLTLLFLAAMGLAAWRGLHASCGCFGPFGGETPVVLWLARNLALGAILLWLWRRRSEISRRV